MSNTHDKINRRNEIKKELEETKVNHDSHRSLKKEYAELRSYFIKHIDELLDLLNSK